MKPTKLSYPFFQANQVLTSDNLNDAFEYLNEQERLTRTNLIGIGIVCGLEITSDNSTIRISKGCGITSEGYLIVEPKDVKLELMQKLELLDYDFFNDNSTPKKLKYPLWELFPLDIPDEEKKNKKPIPSNFLSGHVVLLFLDLKKEPLRNCSPNNCNDKGSTVKVAVRRLLIEKQSMDAINAAANELKTDISFGKSETSLSAQLNLPDLRLRRYDVPNTNPVDSNTVLQAFYKVLNSDNLVEETRKALIQTYKVFEPVLRKKYAQNPFENNVFTDKFGFLKTSPTTDNRVTFLQYYYDFFDDLIRAYDEFRWQGMALMCACCPPEGLFPRHLMVSELPSVSPAHLNVYRHNFIASSAISGCEDRITELVQLFRRMVQMIVQFTSEPLLIDSDYIGMPEGHEQKIHITPSQFGNLPLSNKAIPYYYTKENPPILFEYWSLEKTRRQRSKQNLSYHAKNYPNQSDDFVINPLSYDLENYNFLRIEGHLGKPYTKVMRTLIALKKNYRLPIEIVMLSTTDIVDDAILENDCHFQHLKMLCIGLCCELRQLVKNAIKLLERKDLQLNDGEQQPTIVKAAIDIQIWLNRFTQVLDDNFCKHYALFDGQYQELQALNSKIISQSNEQQKELDDLSWEELISLLDSIIHSCKLEAIKEINDEYNRLKKKYTLAGFLKDHPGIQHKAGVPLGGTFIVVYHGYSKPVAKEAVRNEEKLKALLLNFSENMPDDPSSLDTYLNQFIANQNQQFLLPALQNGLKVLPGNIEAVDAKITEIVNNLENGTVIADFYLPYLCCSDCAPVQFVLPKIPPTFTVQVGCTNAQKQATVTVTPKGGVPPYFYKIGDDKCFKALPDMGLPLSSGKHNLVVGDSMGAESLSQCVVVPEPLKIEYYSDDETYIDDEIAGTNVGTYKVKFMISGGTSPYTAIPPGNIELVDDEYVYTSSDSIRSGDSITVNITDGSDSKCAVSSKSFVHTVCTLPNKGKAIKSGYLLWLPKPTTERKLEAYKAEITAFTFIEPNGEQVKLTISELKNKINAALKDLEFNKFENTVKNWLEVINALVAKKVGGNSFWFKLDYAGNADKIDELRIEYFDHPTFNNFKIEISVSFTYRGISEVRSVIYTQAGTEILIKGRDNQIITNFKLISFNPEITNKCVEGETWNSACVDSKIQVSINTPQNTNNVITLTATDNGTDKATQFLWEVEDAEPSLIVVEAGKSATTKISAIEPKTKNIRLTAFSATGCTATQQSSVDVIEIIG